MRNKLLCFFLLLIVPFSSYAQKEPRQVLYGKVVADSLKTDNISVNNLSSNIGAVTDNDGNFSIYARPTDTLFFSSITFHSVQMVLSKEHFTGKQLVIKLDLNVTMLDEVVIRPTVLLGDLAADSKKTKTMQVTSSLDSKQLVMTAPYKPQSPLNEKRYPNESVLKGIDFIKIFEMFKKRKKKDKAEIYKVAAKSFRESVKERFTYHFFTETIKIPRDEIELFINFCDTKDAAKLLPPDKEFELTDYLVAKSVEYLKLHKK